MIPVPKVSLASEACHYYTIHGEPRYSVENKKGEIVPTTLRHARANGWVPSVSTILKAAAKPGLELWKQQQLLYSALTLPPIDGESLDQFSSRIIGDSKEQAKLAAEKGTAIHTAIEQMLGNRLYDKALELHVNAARTALKEIGISDDYCAEKSFASELGYGGKCDLHTLQPIVVDFKTKSKWSNPKSLAYDEYGMQLAAYGNGFKLENPRLINIFISTENPGDFFIYEWPLEDHPRLWDMFYHILNYWKLSNKYDPSKNHDNTYSLQN